MVLLSHHHSSHIQTILSFPRTYKPSPLPHIPIILTHIYTNHPHTSKPYSHIQHILSFPRTYKPSSLPHIPIIQIPHTYKSSPHIQTIIHTSNTSLVFLTHTNHPHWHTSKSSSRIQLIRSHGISVSLQKWGMISRSHGNVTKSHGI